MDKFKFRQRLEELAEIRDRKPGKSPTHNRLARETVTEIDELTGEEIEVEREVTENPTLGFDLVKVKDRAAVCELGCGDIVTNQLIERKLATYPHKHWRTRCATCDHYVSPDGLGFIRGGHSIQQAYIVYFRNKTAIETATNQAVIRRYE
jgi:hypothetical protein